MEIEMSDRLLTWLDIERQLKKSTALWSQLPKGIIAIDCFPDGMEVHHSLEKSQVQTWLNEIFGHSYVHGEGIIKLRIGDAAYPVTLCLDPQIQAPNSGQTYPLWKDVTYLPKASSDQISSDEKKPNAVPITASPAGWTSGPDMVSFHSFKGGVGRTTALMTYVTACLQEATTGPKKILVIDADLEAPGVSFWLDRVNLPKVSFIQLLEALHYPPSGIDASLNYFSDELRKTSISISGMERELFVLPAALDFSEIQDMPISPEHLARNPSNPWQLSDHLYELGKRLGVDAVFIDLRAGLSELASPILFDPRIDHFFVSTVAPQSVQGMAEILRRLHAFNTRLPPKQKDDARPTVILSLLTKDLRDTQHYQQALKSLGEAYPTEDTLKTGVQWLEAEFLSTLMSLGTVRDALEALPQSNRLFASACEWASALYAPTKLLTSPSTDTEKTGSESLTRQQAANRLYKVCGQAQFSESEGAAPILATEPLLNLGKHYAKDLPNLLMIGAKGSGKTFTYRNLVQTGSWQPFLEKLGFDASGTTNAHIFPVLWSSNIEDKPDGEIKAAQGQVVDLLCGNKDQLLRGSDISRKIQEALVSPPESWEDFWDQLFARQLGVLAGTLSLLNKELSNKSQRVIFVFDGIEDAFNDATKDNSIDAIQALLRLTNRVSELESRHIGIMIFVRADYVQAAIRQNLGQLLQRFQPFRLQWSPEGFLRLAFMLSCQAGIYDEDPKSAESLRIEQLKDKLEALWGKKLGSEKSKEAHSARWVYAALCDLKGNVQARDLVRFLKFASELESGRSGSTWPDRILSPESMRKAIPECSREKVTEAAQEIVPLRNWIELLKESGVQKLRVPFSQTEAKLDAGLLSSLQEIGVIYEDLDSDFGEERLFLPEIYRSGLGFETSAAGRPRTQALLKKNIGSIPL